MTDTWDDPEFRSGSYFQFENDGDSIAGEYQGRAWKTWESGDTSLLIYVEDGTGKQEITCPADLKKKLQEAKPQEGDRILITQIGHTKIAKGTMRFFRVEVQRAEKNPVPINPPKSQEFTANDAVADQMPF